MSEREIEYNQRAGATKLLEEMFGVTNAVVQSDGTVLCHFTAKRGDGRGTETLECVISFKNSPEQNMKTLLEGRRQMAWYATVRDNTHATDVPPPAADDGILDLSPPEDGDGVVARHEH